LAIGNDLAVAEGFEPSHGRINSAVPYQLGYATRSKDEGRRMKELLFGLGSLVCRNDRLVS
jgi:hypothetical protein